MILNDIKIVAKKFVTEGHKYDKNMIKVWGN